MIETHFASFNATDKLIYFEAASNASLQKLISEELKTIEEQILQLDRRTEESDAEFCIRFTKLKINRNLLLAFVDINNKVINEISNSNK